MHSGFTLTLVAVILLALFFDFINGFHDTANAIATSVSTRVLKPNQAILMAVSLNFLGALISTRVATTISKGIVSTSVALPQYVFIGALLSAIVWGLLTWYLGLPSSSTHALIGGLIGAAIAYTMTLNSVLWQGFLEKVIIPLVTSPLLGFAVAFLVMKFLFKILANIALRVVNRWFSKLQILSAAFMAFAHGNNDAQKSMGIITLALVSSGIIASDYGVPWEVKIACAVMMGLGTSVGGWKIIKTIGVNMSKLQPINGFAAETSAAIIIEGASFLGLPVSTTHVISAAIMGVGASRRISAVRWSLAKDIVVGWLLTYPATMLLGFGVTFLLKLL
jgi:inorganic phosphate transporter, PiT family